MSWMLQLPLILIVVFALCLYLPSAIDMTAKQAHPPTDANER